MRLPRSSRACRLGSKLSSRVTWNHFFSSCTGDGSSIQRKTGKPRHSDAGVFRCRGGGSDGEEVVVLVGVSARTDVLFLARAEADEVGAAGFTAPAIGAEPDFEFHPEGRAVVFGVPGAEVHAKTARTTGEGDIAEVASGGGHETVAAGGTAGAVVGDEFEEAFPKCAGVNGPDVTGAALRANDGAATGQRANEPPPEGKTCRPPSLH